MIKNERQYQVTTAQARRLQEALDQLEGAGTPPDLHPRLVAAEKEAVASQLADLQEELAEYESLRGSRESFPRMLQAFEVLPDDLVRARIALGMLQRELADRVGLKEQQISLYERTNYRSASLARAGMIARALVDAAKERWTAEEASPGGPERAPTSTARGVDALRVLHDEHRSIDELLSEFEKLSPRAYRKKATLTGKLQQQVDAYVGAVESAFYPAVRERIPEARPKVSQALDELSVVKERLSRLAETDPKDEGFDATTYLFRAAITEHIEDTESTLFPVIRKRLPLAERRSIGSAVARASGARS